MAIPDDKARLIVTLPDKLKSDFELLCELDKRTASKQFEYILEYYIENVEGRLCDKDYNKYYEDIYLRNQLIDEITHFLKKKDGRYKGKVISKEYFYEVFKDENIDNEIVKKVIDNLIRMDIPMTEFLLNCVNYHELKNESKKD